MRLYTENENYKLYHGNMLDMLDVIEPNTIDSIVTDPPYELNFMSKGWDNAGVSFQKETWQKCYEVLKPGGYLLAFGGSRTFHRIACAIEDAGFEIRDTICWMYGMGFPKSMDISKQIDKRNKNTKEEYIKLGNYLKEKREENKISKIDLGQRLFNFDSNREDVPIQSWEIGKEIPTKENYLKLKEILKLDDSYDWLIEREEAEREVIGKKESGCFNNQETNRYTIGSSKALEVDITAPSTELAKQWQGWGTALKPSYESIIIAQKPYSIEIYLLIGILDILNEVIEKCQLNLNANIVKKISKLNQAKQSVEENIVLNNAESKMFTKEDLLEVMDMLQSILTENTNLNTELLCLNFLVEICNQMSKYTTETKINLITELKILKLLVVENILKNTTEENKIKQLGMKQNALTVEEFLKEEKLKLNYINILSAQDNAILKEEKNDLHPKLNQIIVARKPFKGSLVDNVIENGVGGINIDECRVGNEERINKEHGYSNVMIGGCFEKGTTEKKEYKASGRFPANTILTYDETDFDEVCGGFPIRNSSNGSITNPNLKNSLGNRGIYSKYSEKQPLWEAYQDSGSASRYFMNCKYTGKDEEFRRYIYTPKASKRDRDEGLDEFEDVDGGSYQFRQDGSLDGKIPVRKNTHPTVKPTSLMQYLVRLVTPNGGTILDPFNGSGSTGKAVMYENLERSKNYKYIGIELTEEYLPIAKARIEYVCNLKGEKQTSIEDFIENEKD